MIRRIKTDLGIEKNENYNLVEKLAFHSPFICMVLVMHGKTD